MRVTKKTKVHQGLYVIECPRCGAILASAAEIDWLPEFATCDCTDIKDNKKQNNEKKI